MKIKNLVRLLILSLLLVAETALGQQAIRVGVLHSLRGTMAISEATLKDAMLMLIERQNERGGLLGRPLEAVVLDPESNWLLYAEKARQLIERERVAVIFGCWSSASRKAVLPVVEELNALLFYPVQYEGQESSPNIFYFGATPNQQALPAVQFLQDERGIERWVLAGTDYVYPRTVNRILAAYLVSRGVSEDDIMLSYTPFGHTDWQRIVTDIRSFATQGKKTAVVSTINGDANEWFYRELVAQGVSAEQLPVLAFSVGEEELRQLDVDALAGHLAAWNYFMSIDSAENHAFVADWQAYTGQRTRVTNDPIEAHYIGFSLWVEAVKRAGTVDTDKVRKAMIGLRVPNLAGGTAEMLANHHVTKPVYVGQIRSDGQYRVIWRSTQTVPAQVWSEFLPTPYAQGLE